VIYLDYAATTPCSAEVVEAMLPYFSDAFANASSIDHLPGARARKAVDEARERVAALVGAAPEDVIFTSGSTEANNLALSVSSAVLTTTIEHPSIREPFARRKNPADRLLPVDENGRISIGDLDKILRDRPDSLVSIIATNNETGTEQDVQAIAAVCKRYNVLFHTDATQAVGTRSLNLGRDGIDACSLSAHKIYGPKGIGALIVRSRLRRRLSPFSYGGGHERGLRSGTLNVPGIVGFGVAAALTATQHNERRRRLDVLRIKFLDALRSIIQDRVVPTVLLENASPHVLSLRLRGINNRALLRAASREVAFSLGSACATNKNEPSGILLALGLDKSQVNETIRCSFSANQTEAEVQAAAGVIAGAAQGLAGFSLSA